ncbi:MAG: class I SAM-dependent methyltransferase [Nitrososphaerota archaeon]
MTLDIGCGFSKESIIGKKYKANPRGDLNVDICKPEVKVPNFIRASALSLPFKEDIFDTIYMFHVIEHLEDPKRALNEIHKVLRKGGKLVVITPNKYSRSSYLDPTHRHHFTPGELKKLFRSFSSVKLTGEGGCWIPLKGNTNVWGKIVGRIYPGLAKDIKIMAKK